MANAIAQRSSQQLAQTTVGKKIFSDHELGEEFSALIIDYTPRQLAKFSGCTIEGARHWPTGRRRPGLAVAINIAQHIPAVAEWIIAKIGHTRAAQANSYDAWLAGLYAIAAGHGPDAMKARWAIAQLDRAPEPEPRTGNVICDLFERKRA